MTNKDTKWEATRREFKLYFGYKPVFIPRKQVRDMIVEKQNEAKLRAMKAEAEAKLHEERTR